MIFQALPPDWQEALKSEREEPYLAELEAFLDSERRLNTIYPSKENVFTALKLTPLNRVRVVILGQDPYHGEGQAHGLCFSVLPGVKPPPSLVNICKELRDDLGIPMASQGYLTPWAEQGILMLNTVLTVQAETPLSHRNRGWERFTGAILEQVNQLDRQVIFLLWGSPAQKRAETIDAEKHTLLKAVHPSPLSAHRGFFGCRHFSAVNRLLEEQGAPPIVWTLPE